MKTAILALVLLLFVAGCGTSPTRVQLTIAEGVAIPEGYTLIEASAYGQYTNYLTLYIQNRETGRVYEYRNGEIGNEIIIPDGYTLVAISAYGAYGNYVTFYCKKNGTEQVFVCKPK